MYTIDFYLQLPVKISYNANAGAFDAPHTPCPLRQHFYLKDLWVLEGLSDKNTAKGGTTQEGHQHSGIFILA